MSLSVVSVWPGSHWPRLRLTWAALCLCLLGTLGSANSPGSATTFSLDKHGRLYAAKSAAFPRDFAALPAWEAALSPEDRVSLTGGAYWLVGEFVNTSDERAWVFAPQGTLIDRVEARLYFPDGRAVRLRTGYQHELTYALHYGKDVTLAPGARVRLVVRFESPYYASAPDFDLVPRRDYRRAAQRDNLLIVGALGALLTLAVYNLFISVTTRDTSLLLYAAYMLTYCVAWAFTFHLPAQILGWRDLRWHYVGFFLLPVLNTLFYVRFLRLDEHFPRLARLSRVNVWMPLALLPTSFLLLSHAHLLATAVISVWLVLALVCGVASWRRGFRPARYFVLAFVALLIPGALILPANAGLVPDLVANSELLTLLGGTLDGLLLAFALAERITGLQREKDATMQRLTQALTLASTDAMTGIPNRHAFDQFFGAADDAPDAHADEALVLALIDLDGLKMVNDRHGHARGDALLRRFAALLGELRSEHTHVFRLGGDEFVVVACARQEARLRAALPELETRLHDEGFRETGVSFGLAPLARRDGPSDALQLADQLMYAYKLRRERTRPVTPNFDGRRAAPNNEP